ncbi:hypothetical protein SAMN05421664_2859 [Chryseobacterium soldanellicola]|uniref:DUF6759 domain-containing protein n=1 Tax=Chryseobacterium soldanellicola TaxID=311333 RepID=A0A1H1EAG1_9FLAO|nr:DUF6759 domain-containing protein [Chryseobacterium soldanellicola]SDQ85634.1 hypothetical protein SAMN05421664_2859 [Chryseobacterium soldanellicola]
MKKFLFCSFLLLLLANCSVNHHTKVPPKAPISKPKPKPAVSNTSKISQAELEYSNLIKTYKPETAEVLTDILNGSDGPTTSIRIENLSRCNMVLTISGNNYFKKIPIASGKIGSAMVPKNQNYNLSGTICNSVYQKTKFISSSSSIKISN